jgi:hypothetical protein
VSDARAVTEGEASKARAGESREKGAYHLVHLVLDFLVVHCTGVGHVNKGKRERKDGWL